MFRRRWALKGRGEPAVQPATAYGWLVWLRKLDVFYQGVRWNKNIISQFLCPTTFENGIQRND